MDIYFDENTNEEDDITLRYVDHDDIVSIIDIYILLIKQYLY